MMYNYSHFGITPPKGLYISHYSILKRIFIGSLLFYTKIFYLGPEQANTALIDLLADEATLQSLGKRFLKTREGFQDSYGRHVFVSSSCSCYAQVESTRSRNVLYMPHYSV